MSKEKYRITNYLPLVAIMAASLVGFYLFSHDRALRISLTIATGISYFVWGIIHHYINKDLNAEIFIEYFVISVFGVIAVASLVV